MCFASTSDLRLAVPHCKGSRSFQRPFDNTVIALALRHQGNVKSLAVAWNALDFTLAFGRPTLLREVSFDIQTAFCLDK